MKDYLELETFLDSMKSILMKVLMMEDLGIPVTRKTDLISGVGVNDLALSSIDYVAFMVEVEIEYNIIYDFDVRIHTIGDVYDYIVAYRKAHEGEGV